MITKIDALLSLIPQAKFHTNDSNIIWEDNRSQPTGDEIDSEVIRLQEEWTAQEYARKREAEYPSIEECVHAILDDDLTALQEKRQAIKTKYPKG